QLRLWRPRVRPAQLPGALRQPREGPAVDQGVLAPRARQQGRPANLPGVPEPEGAAGGGREAGGPDPFGGPRPEAGREAPGGWRRGDPDLPRPAAPEVPEFGGLPDRPPEAMTGWSAPGAREGVRGRNDVRQSPPD